jgi:hypothetical protein
LHKRTDLPTDLAQNSIISQLALHKRANQECQYFSTLQKGTDLPNGLAQKYQTKSREPTKPQITYNHGTTQGSEGAADDVIFH